MDLRPELTPPPVSPERLTHLCDAIERIADLVPSRSPDAEAAITAFNAHTGHTYVAVDFAEYEGSRSTADFAREAARPARPRSTDITREELVEITRRLLTADPDTDYYLRLLQANVPHPGSATSSSTPRPPSGTPPRNRSSTRRSPTGRLPCERRAPRERDQRNPVETVTAVGHPAAMKFVDVNGRIGQLGGVISPLRYLARLPEISDGLPPGARAFATDADHYDFAGKRCVKDLMLHHLVLPDDHRGDAVAHFRHNCWKHEEDLVIRYTGVTDLALDSPNADRTGLGPVILDEILPHEHGCTHETAFRPGTLIVTARDLTATWIEATCEDSLDPGRRG
ncbi:hypothetical protein [Kitasatospora sp. NPDC059571]|uniref:hypothetical protein n=1 Tax=Kitasatospora sp. NPDC059571 TaxID=3346871 RepID=UPI00368C29E7